MKRNSFFLYRVQHWDEIAKTMETASGIAVGNSYSNVVARLEKYYNLEDILELKYIDEGYVLDFEVQDSDYNFLTVKKGVKPIGPVEGDPNYVQFQMNPPMDDAWAEDVEDREEGWGPIIWCGAVKPKGEVK